ncbi:MAG TPA: hypothetical protein VK978_02085 [Candidatus Saccharimonadales bacterium]|nr:hypothetical protein [Candidatus Saccharimonadales bacterium]
MQFRVTGTTPHHRNYPASLGTMDIYFSKPVDKPALEERLKHNVSEIITLDFDSAVRTVVDNNKLRLTFSRTPMPGEYNITLNDVASTGGEVIDVNLPFLVKDIPYEKLTKEEKALFDELAKGNGEDHLEDFPLLERLPYQTDKYEVDYRFDEADPAPTLIITMKFFAPGSNAVPATPAEQQAYLNDVRKYRTEALAWLQAEQPSYKEKYVIEYTEIELREEFPAGRPRYFEGEGDTHPDHPEG